MHIYSVFRIRSALIWISRIRIRTGNTDSDPDHDAINFGKITLSYTDSADSDPLTFQKSFFYMLVEWVPLPTSGPRMIFSDPNPTFKLVSDPNPTFKLVSDPYPDHVPDTT